LAKHPPPRGGVLLEARNAPHPSHHLVRSWSAQMLRSPLLDRLWLEFSGSLMMTDWLLHRDLHLNRDVASDLAVGPYLVAVSMTIVQLSVGITVAESSSYRRSRFSSRSAHPKCPLSPWFNLNQPKR
jgi:hypothetical protein